MGNSGSCPTKYQIGMKSKVMSNLRQLKEADERFKGVSISNDLTPKQQEEIKKLIADVKKDHSENSTEDEENFRFLVLGHGHRKRYQGKKELRCLLFISRSIVNKFDLFQATVSVLNVDVIGVTETWLTSEFGYIGFRNTVGRL